VSAEQTAAEAVNGRQPRPIDLPGLINKPSRTQRKPNPFGQLAGSLLGECYRDDLIAGRACASCQTRLLL